MNYSVDVPSLKRHFPPNFEVPPLLIEFGNWLKKKRFGSLGYFSLQSERFDDFWIENGADLHPNFAFFMRDPTGGRIGYWLYQGCDPNSVPIVMVGSEGELNIISNSLPEFLHQLAAGKTEVYDLDSHQEGTREEKALTKWLTTHAVADLPKKPVEHPDLRRWMDNWGQQKRDWINNDPVHRQIADQLRKHVKPNAEPWESTHFDVVLVGTEFKMWHRSFGPKPMPKAELAKLHDLFDAVRTQRAVEMPDRGLWFSAYVNVGSTGGAVLCCNFLDMPKILDEYIEIPISEYAHDLQAYPRSKHWTPDWL